MPKLNYIEINPEKKQPVGTVIWMHGLGADGHDFAPMIPELKLPHELPLRFIFPHAPLRPVTLNNGYVMRAWFDIYSLNRNAKIDLVGIDESVRNINELMTQEEERGISPNRIIIAGFSQGCVVALNVGLRYPKRLATIIGLSGYLPNAVDLIKNAQPANNETPIFIGHGTEDNVVPYFYGQQSFEILKRNNFNVSWHSYKMGHSVCGEEIKDLGEWVVKAYETVALKAP